MFETARKVTLMLYFHHELQFSRYKKERAFELFLGISRKNKKFAEISLIKSHKFKYITIIKYTFARQFYHF